MNGNLAYQNERWEELIDGEVVMMAPASTGHAAISGNIYNIFKNYLKGKKCAPFVEGPLVYLTEKDHFVPDFMVVCDRSKLKSSGLHGAPDLVVEILSPSTGKRDRSYKKDVYERCGVREYWLVSPGDQYVEQYLLEDGELKLHDVCAHYPDWELEAMSEEKRAAVISSFKCSLFDDLDISLDDIFDFPFDF